jgi:putative NADH-flavin reductase
MVIHDEPNARRNMTLWHVDGTGSRSFALLLGPDGITSVQVVEEFDSPRSEDRPASGRQVLPEPAADLPARLGKGTGMRITVFGASGSVGDWLVPEALRRGHEVVAVTRQRSRITTQHPNLSVMQADLDDIAALEKTLTGSHAAIISLADPVVHTGTRSIVTAMRTAGVPRVEALTGFGTSAISRRQLNPLMRAVVAAIRVITLPSFRAKEDQDAILRASGLTFTIVQPPTLTTGPATGTYRHGDYRGKSILGNISRADLAAFMLDNLEQDRYLNQSAYVQR